MKKLLTLTLLTFFIACGVHVTSDPIKVEGNVTHTIVIDAKQLSEFFTAYCVARPENDTEEKVNVCVTSQLVFFWQAIMKAGSQITTKEEQ